MKLSNPGKCQTYTSKGWIFPQIIFFGEKHYVRVQDGEKVDIWEFRGRLGNGTVWENTVKLGS